MKLIALLLLFSIQSTAQKITAPQAQKFSKEIISCIKKNSIFRDSLNFETIEKDFEQQLDSFDTYNKIGAYYTQQLRKAGDKHSFYVAKGEIDKYSAKQKEYLGFSYKLLEGNIGYLSIPGFLSTDNSVKNSFANQIYAAIREMDSQQDIKGWILDLRNNNGGDMWPMLMGLQPLLGNDVPGYFANTGQKKLTEWKANPAVFGISFKEPYQLKKSTNKIAVLYSKQTISSGETIAICFIGKPGAKSFGSITGGLTTANNLFYLGEDNIFVLASSYSMDRNKKVYTSSIIPDLLIENTANDNVLHQAENWIKQ